MRNIIVVECISTGINFIEDIIHRGYNPIVLEPKTIDTEMGNEYKIMVEECYGLIEYDFEIIKEKDTYQETLDMVKEYDPVLIVAGSEKGVVLSVKLSNDLNLLTNPIENLNAMTLKNEMQLRLKENGLRYIRGKVVKTLEEAIDYYDSEGLEAVVLKPIYSAGSASVRICFNKEEMIESFKTLLTKSNYYGNPNIELLIQEYIDGIEYVVNTVSCEGQHLVTTFWKYNKIRTKTGAIVYDTFETINNLNIGEAEIIEYAYKVADALGIEYGPVHGEYMVDEKGPVLIEVNCRPCGGNLPAKYLDRISGQHETDTILDAFLKPDLFKHYLYKPYRLHAYGALKFFIIPEDMFINSAPINKISSNLKSHYQTSLVKITDTSRLFNKTEDLHTSGGVVYLVDENQSQLQSTINYLRDVEKQAFSLILSDNAHNISSEPDEKFLIEFKEIIDSLQRLGTGLLVTDQFISDANILQVGIEDLENIKGDFDFVIMNLNKSFIDRGENTIIDVYLQILSKIRTGGFVVISKYTYNLLKNGRKEMEALVKTLDLQIELPPNGISDFIIASRSLHNLPI